MSTATRVEAASPARQRVLDMATAMFAERGYVATSMRDIAAALGIKGASLYSHFPDKEAILYAVTAPLLDAVDQLLQQPPADDSDRARWLNAYAQTLLRYPKLVRIVAAELTVAPHGSVGKRVCDQDAQVRKLIQANGNEMIAAGAVGIMWWPLLCLPKRPTPAAARQLAHLTISAIATAGKPPASRQGTRTA